MKKKRQSDFAFAAELTRKPSTQTKASGVAGDTFGRGFAQKVALLIGASPIGSGSGNYYCWRQKNCLIKTLSASKRMFSVYTSSETKAAMIIFAADRIDDQLKIYSLSMGDFVNERPLKELRRGVTRRLISLTEVQSLGSNLQYDQIAWSKIKAAYC